MWQIPTLLKFVSMSFPVIGTRYWQLYGTKHIPQYFACFVNSIPDHAFAQAELKMQTSEAVPCVKVPLERKDTNVLSLKICIKI